MSHAEIPYQKSKPLPKWFFQTETTEFIHSLYFIEYNLRIKFRRLYCILSIKTIFVYNCIFFINYTRYFRPELTVKKLSAGPVYICPLRRRFGGRCVYNALRRTQRMSSRQQRSITYVRSTTSKDVFMLSNYGTGPGVRLCIRLVLFGNFFLPLPQSFTVHKKLQKNPLEKKI